MKGCMDSVKLQMRINAWLLLLIFHYWVANVRDLIRSGMIPKFQTSSDGDLTCMSADGYVK